MNKISILLLAVLIGFMPVVNAQMRHGIGLHFGAYDFYGPQTGDYFLGDQYRYQYNDQSDRYDSSIRSAFFWRPMVKGTYWLEYNKWFDFSAALSFSHLEYPRANPDQAFIDKYYFNSAGDRIEQFLGELDVRANFNFLQKDSFIASPYVLAGLGLSYYDIFWGANIPVGLGVNIKLSRDFFINVESNYKVALTAHNQHHLQHSLGFIYWFDPGYVAPPTAARDLAPAPDMDKDGIADTADQCPGIAGMRDLNGCPDSDGDGIADNTDTCPLVAGSAALNGCPDSDNDGIPDNTDQCPYAAGTQETNGCPVQEPPAPPQPTSPTENNTEGTQGEQ